MVNEFIVNKENDAHQLLISLPTGTRQYFDTKFHPSNYPLRVVKNKYGKVIIACDANTIYIQTIMANTKLLSNSKHIDFNFLNDIYYPKIKELLNKNPFVAKKEDFNILVIAEGKSYEIFSDGYIKEDDLLCSVTGLGGMYIGLYDLYKNHDRKFLEKVFDSYGENYIDHVFPAVYIDTKTFKPVVIRRAHL